MSDIERPSIKDGSGRRRKPGELPTRKVAIRLHCIECCGYQRAEVRRCDNRKCWLWPYRMGTTEKDAVAAETPKNSTEEGSDE